MLPVPVHELATTEQFVPSWTAFPTKFPPGERFSYCNGGYVVLALIAERASGVPYHDLVGSGSASRPGWRDTAFLRSDELPGRAAARLPAERRTAGAPTCSTCRCAATATAGSTPRVADLSTLLAALFAGRIVPARWVAEMVRPRSDVPAEPMRYGLGFWLHGHGTTVMLMGYDAGVSFRSVHDPGPASPTP